MSGRPGRGPQESADRIVYSLGSSPAERDRLRRQSAELRDHSALLLDRVGVAEGWRVRNMRPKIVASGLRLPPRR
jgi:hypothetical protein